MYGFVNILELHGIKTFEIYGKVLRPSWQMIVFVIARAYNATNKGRIKMKNLTPVTKTIPAVAIFDFVGKILSHSENMDRMKKEYTIAKRQLDYKYKIEQQNLMTNMEQFKSMIKMQRAYFDGYHKERLKLLKSIDRLSAKLCQIEDKYVIEVLKNSLELLLEAYSNNHRNHVHFIGERKSIEYKGEL